MKQPVMYIGTIGQSVWRSTDLGDSWKRASNGIFAEADIRAIAIDPGNSSVVFAGTENGLYRTADGAETWQFVDSEMNGLQIWDIEISEKNPNTIFVGTCPSDLFKSTDGGKTWIRLDVELADECAGGAIIPRVTSIAIDPEDDQVVYAGIEIDGFRRSTDGGKNWETINEGLSSLDIHGISVIPGQPKKIIVATNNDVCRTDNLKYWTPLTVKDYLPWSYARAVFYCPNGENRVYLGAGNGPPGNEGGIFYSVDLGDSWEQAELGMMSNSTIWNFAYNGNIDDLIVAYSVSGQIFRSTDHGNSWQKLTREFGEVRALAITS